MFHATALLSSPLSSIKLNVPSETCNNLGIPFFAIVTQGIPRLLHVSDGTLSLIEESGDDNKAVACHVVLDGDVAVIPDMDVIEAMLKDVFEIKKKKSASKKKTESKKKK